MHVSQPRVGCSWRNKSSDPTRPRRALSRSLIGGCTARVLPVVRPLGPRHGRRGLRPSPCPPWHGLPFTTPLPDRPCESASGVASPLAPQCDCLPRPARRRRPDVQTRHGTGPSLHTASFTSVIRSVAFMVTATGASTLPFRSPIPSRVALTSRNDSRSLFSARHWLDYPVVRLRIIFNSYPSHAAYADSQLLRPTLNRCPDWSNVSGWS